MHIDGTVIKVTPTQMIGQEGTLAKRSIILQTDGQYPKTIAFDLLGDICETADGLSGKARIHFDLQSNQSKQQPDRYFTSAKAWKWEAVDAASEQPNISDEDDNNVPF